MPLVKILEHLFLANSTQSNPTKLISAFKPLLVTLRDVVPQTEPLSCYDHSSSEVQRIVKLESGREALMSEVGKCQANFSFSSLTFISSNLISDPYKHISSASYITPFWPFISIPKSGGNFSSTYTL